MRLLTKELLAKILNALTGAIVVETRQVAVSFSNQRYKIYSVDVSKSGYTPLGLIGWNTQTVDWHFSQYYISGDTAHLTIFRASSIASASVTMTLYVLYRKNT